MNNVVSHSPSNNTMDMMYTDVIEPAIYNKILTQQHIYISQAERVLMQFIHDYVKNEVKEIIELGCGPAHALKLLCDLQKNSNITGIDIDEKFLGYASYILENVSNKPHIVHGNVLTYKHPCSVDVFFSCGMHHHIAKGDDVHIYLKNINSQLKDNGIYVLMDEFIPDYKNEEERCIRLTIWYAHVIAHALKYGYQYLAEEESRIFLDDILEGKTHSAYKTKSQVDFIQAHVSEINDYALKDDFNNATVCAKKMLHFINKSFSVKTSNNKIYDISRKDYKISVAEFNKEIHQAGFKVKIQKSVGNIEDIGALCVFVLEKG